MTDYQLYRLLRSLARADRQAGFLQTADVLDAQAVHVAVRVGQN